MANTHPKVILDDGTVVESFGGTSDLVDVTSWSVPNPSWSWTCPKGHVVRYERDEEYTGPSSYHLVGAKEVRAPAWLYDPEYGPETVTVCGVCKRGRKIIDFYGSTRSNTQREYIAGMTTYMLNGEIITKERAEEVIAAYSKARAGA